MGVFAGGVFHLFLERVFQWGREGGQVDAGGRTFLL